MNPLVIAVDTGNKNIKTPHTEPFNSGLICHGAIPPAVKSIRFSLTATIIPLLSLVSLICTIKRRTGPITF